MDELDLIGGLEAWLKDRLTATLEAAGVQVIEFPDAKSSGRPITAKQLYVGFVREESTDPKPSTLKMVGHPLYQEDILIFEASIHLKDLRSHQGIYPLKQAIKRAIKGSRPLREHPTSAFWIRRFGFDSLDQGVWSYNLDIAINAPEYYL